MLVSERQILQGLFVAHEFPPDAFYGARVFGNRPIIVYGAGEGFHWIEEILMRFYGWMPSLVLDRRFGTGDLFKGIPACSPDQYSPTPNEQREAVVIVAVGKRDYHDEIRATLRGKGFQRVVMLMDIYEVHNPFRQPPELEAEGFAFFERRRSRIESALDLFVDDLSRTVFLRALETHMTRRPVPIPCSPRHEQYFPSDLHLERGHRRFVNCGAYDGDTVRMLVDARGKVDEVVCLEAEPALFAKLTDYLAREHDRIAPRTVALPCAAYSHEALLPFRSGGGLGSRVTPDGDMVVQTVALDHVLPGFEPTFIAMDVEGAEPEVLRGAEVTLRSCTPDLGVCVYHAPHHLWDIPLFLDALNLGYRLYLRNYTSFYAETVLYATAP